MSIVASRERPRYIAGIVYAIINNSRDDEYVRSMTEVAFGQKSALLKISNVSTKVALALLRASKYLGVLRRALAFPVMSYRVQYGMVVSAVPIYRGALWHQVTGVSGNTANSLLCVRVKCVQERRAKTQINSHCGWQKGRWKSSAHKGANWKYKSIAINGRKEGKMS